MADDYATEMEICERVVKLRTGIKMDGMDINPFYQSGKSVTKNIQCSDVDMKQFRMGMKIEMEHSTNPLIRCKITLDHVAESKIYYYALEPMEDMIKRIERMPIGTEVRTKKKLVDRHDSLHPVAGQNGRVANITEFNKEFNQPFIDVHFERPVDCWDGTKIIECPINPKHPEFVARFFVEELKLPHEKSKDWTEDDEMAVQRGMDTLKAEPGLERMRRRGRD